MLDSVSNTPLIGHKGENLNLIQINFDHSDSSTGESNPSGEVSKYENIIEDKNKPKGPTFLCNRNSCKGKSRSRRQK